MFERFLQLFPTINLPGGVFHGSTRFSKLGAEPGAPQRYYPQGGAARDRVGRNACRSKR